MSTALPVSPSRRPLWRRPEFASAAVRAAATVFSVLWFGLSPAAAVVLFCFEAWIFITLRSAVEIAVDAARRDEQFLRRLLRELPARILAASVLWGLWIGLCGFVISYTLYEAHSVTGWVTHLLAEPGLISGIGVVFLFDAIAAGRYASALRADIELEKPDLMLTLMRVVFLMFPGALLNQFNVTTGFLGWTMLIAMVLSILLFEGLPTVARRVISRPRSARP